ncbi:MAG: 23S rRNA (guanosine(2251)-2'-O)-methyltransferase RlmB [gamma proteobacterium symbiont of Taylorina sp.]|nr:23S rRNA (guanosine(2251)-2'-O)-methyltransferase RlmB [gamma proteobacterium symbiont of Taylorina sp.]
MDQLIYGIHAVKSALNYCSENPAADNSQRNVIDENGVSIVFVDRGRKDNRINSIVELAKRKSVKVTFVQRKKLDELTDSHHQGVVAQTNIPKLKTENFLDELLQNIQEPPFLLILDGVQDPHNLGACLRSADAAGIHAIIVPKDKSASITPIVRKVACGADQTVPLIYVTNLARTLKLLKSYQIWVVGTAGETEDTLYSSDLTGPLAIVMGMEGKGMRRLTRENCDSLIKIPMQGQVESLNVSVATGICLFEAIRQRRK